jgi:hypothetical protein
MAPLGGTSPLFLKSVSQRSNNTFYREKPLAFRDHNKGFQYLLSQTIGPPPLSRWSSFFIGTLGV